MNRIIKNDENGMATTFEFASTVQNISGDGFGPMLIGFPFTKVSVVQQRIQRPNADSVEKEVVAVLTIPTHALLELADNVRAALKPNREAVEQQTDQMLKVIFPA
ncbi:hypothetical protein [Achromobacter mucicolens]|uniref:hypothetical protein n=1 Tax=Achromobacter mucicolens TaxID=1389922 RepID=UPI0022F3E8B0|nr:hypothetical protein [Achromobacter mucicolens]WBX91592.1 hypothetical protein PE062_13420 [Achromobacter mucicolens]